MGRIFGYEPLYATALTERLGSAAAVFGLPEEEVGRILGPHSKFRGMIGRAALEAAEADLERLEGLGCHYVARSEEAFPKLLKDCPDCPTGLYYRSDSAPEEIFADAPAIAVVGTRDISPYGREWTRKIVDACAQAPVKPVIVSGLAFGVDITAHLAALDGGLRTIAVLPCGIDEVYPASHRKAAERIAAGAGSALVTDYPPHTSPAAFTFVRRNRIIAGLAGCTVLVESKASGGGLITCRLADSYGREVFALPGRVDDPRSAGCNALIRNRTAEAITGLAGLGAQLGLGRYELRRKKDFVQVVSEFYGRKPGFADAELIRSAAELIAAKRGIDIEELCYSLNLPYNEAARLVTILESDAFISTDLTGRCTINPGNS